MIQDHAGPACDALEDVLLRGTGAGAHPRCGAAIDPAVDAQVLAPDLERKLRKALERRAPYPPPSAFSPLLAPIRAFRAEVAIPVAVRARRLRAPLRASCRPAHSQSSLLAWLAPSRVAERRRGVSRHPADLLESNTMADTPALVDYEIEVTPEMIEAGVSVLLSDDGVRDGVGFFSPSVVAEKVFLAMDRQRKSMSG
jgi:hypothetical protein